ncbi:MAG: hypothetical protein ACN6PF_27950 [Achromobacter veterisilvae]
MYGSEWIAPIWGSIRGLLPAGESEFWTAVSAIVTAFAAIVALIVGLAPLWVDRHRRKSEALMRAAHFVMVCKVAAASLRAVHAVFQKHPLDKFGGAHCDVLLEAIAHAEMPALDASELNGLGLLIGRKRALALAVGLGTVESLSPRAKALKFQCEGQQDPEALAGHVRAFLSDANGASEIFREVRAILEKKLARQI